MNTKVRESVCHIYRKLVDSQIIFIWRIYLYFCGKLVRVEVWSDS